MESSEEGKTLEVKTFNHITAGENGEVEVFLSIVEYENAIQASVYTGQPKLGSMTLGYQLTDNVNREVIFAGKNDQMASALAMMLAKKREKIIYASVHIPEEVVINLEIIRKLVEEYENN